MSPIEQLEQSQKNAEALLDTGAFGDDSEESEAVIWTNAMKYAISVVRGELVQDPMAKKLKEIQEAMEE